MKKTIGYLLTVAITLSLCACGNSGKNTYYTDTPLEKLETFTQITGMELNVKKEQDGAILYNYLLDNDASGVGAVTKYESYLVDYGFTLSEEFSVGGVNSYVKDDYLLMTVSENPQENVIQYVVAVPRTTAVAEGEAASDGNNGDIETGYSELLDLVAAEKYEEAVALYQNTDFNEYKDSKEYMFYAEAMQYYQSTYYGAALDLFENYCPNILDAQTHIEEIEAIVSPLEGVYMNTSVGFDGMYVFIKDGLVGTEMTTDGIPSQATYLQTLFDYTFTTGEKTLAFGYADSGDADYILRISGNTISTILAPEGSSYTTFSGAYKKVLDHAPEKK